MTLLQWMLGLLSCIAVVQRASTSSSMPVEYAPISKFFSQYGIKERCQTVIIDHVGLSNAENYYAGPDFALHGMGTQLKEAINFLYRLATMVDPLVPRPRSGNDAVTYFNNFMKSVDLAQRRSWFISTYSELHRTLSGHHFSDVYGLNNILISGIRDKESYEKWIECLEGPMSVTDLVKLYSFNDPSFSMRHSRFFHPTGQIHLRSPSSKAQALKDAVYWAHFVHLAQEVGNYLPRLYLPLSNSPNLIAWFDNDREQMVPLYERENGINDIMQGLVGSLDTVGVMTTMGSLLDVRSVTIKYFEKTICEDVKRDLRDYDISHGLFNRFYRSLDVKEDLHLYYMMIGHCGMRAIPHLERLLASLERSGEQYFSNGDPPLYV